MLLALKKKRFWIDFISVSREGKEEVPGRATEIWVEAPEAAWRIEVSLFSENLK